MRAGRTVAGQSRWHVTSQSSSTAARHGGRRGRWRLGVTCSHAATAGGRANEVHHIIEPAAGEHRQPAIALGLDNLMSLCRACHSARTAGACDVGEGYAFDAEGQVVRVGTPPHA
jgi:5-methylcytosine-specific restriction endonuclease McrA